MDSARHKEILTILSKSSGLPFQRTINNLVKNTKGYSTNYEVPFTFPDSNGPILGVQGSIDIVGFYSLHDKYLPCLFIECKRAYREYKSWVILGKNKVGKILCVARLRKTNPQGEYSYSTFFEPVELNGIETDLYMGEHIVEINEKNKDINTNHQDTAQKSLLQANHGLKAIASGTSFENILEVAKTQKELVQLFMPVVVTNAELLIMDFDRYQADLSTGMLDVDIAELKSVPWVIYNYDPPDYLSIRGQIDPNQAETEVLNRRHTFIVNSNHLQDFLNKLTEVSTRR